MSEILKALYDSPHSQGKGARLELALVDILEDLGFKDIRRQSSGSQYGFDVIAYKDSSIDGRREVWKFECKNLSNQITVEDVAPKLIWHFGQATIDRFVLVGPSTINNDLQHLLERGHFPVPISVWTDQVLERLIRHSPRALKRLGLDTDPTHGSLVAEDIPSYEPRLVAFDVVHQLDPPFSFDYVKLDGGVVKAFTEQELRLLATVTNLSKMPIDIRALEISTLAYQQFTGRVLRLHKLKGLYKPREFSFRPSRVPGGSVELLGREVWRVDGGAAECMAFVLDSETPAGLYHLMFRITGTVAGELVERCSPSFVLHVAGENTNLLSLYVLRRHYDMPAELILNLDDSSWESLVREVKNSGRMTFLGPTLHEAMNGYKDRNWTIRALAIDPQGDGSTAWIDPKQPSELVLDLGVPVDEELHCGPLGAIEYVLTPDEWQDILPVQLKRRIKEE